MSAGALETRARARISTYPTAVERAIALTLVTLGFSAGEMISARMGGRLDVPWAYAVGASATAIGLLFGSSTLILGTRAFVFARATRPSQRALLGAIDGAVLGLLVVFMQWYASIPRPAPLKWAALGIFTLTGSIAANALPPRPLLGFVVAIFAILVCLFGLETLPPQELLFLRVAMLLVFIDASSRVLAPFIPARRVRVKHVLCSAALAFAGACLAFTTSPTLRSVTFHARASAFTFVRAFVQTFPGVSFAKDRRDSPTCSDQVEHRASKIHSRTSGSLPQADLLILTIDAFRWDHASAMKEAFDALGPHVTFTRAISPAPHTMLALAAVFRGVTTREVPFGRALGMHAPTAAASPTLGKMLADSGYRAVSIPTHRFFDPRARLDPDFEIARVDDRPVFEGDPGGGRVVLRHPEVLWRALKVARRTKTPLALWTHLMDAHAPYRYGKHKGPPTRKGQKRALRSLSREIATFLPRYRALRKPRPLIVAILGDHGEEFLEHGGTNHGSSAFAELARVAFVLSIPGVSDARVDAPVSTSSLTPTLLDLLGIEPHARVSMPSLLPCLERESACPKAARTEQLRDGGWVSYTTRRHRLVTNLRFGIEMLFDTESDPYDQHNLMVPGSGYASALHEVRAAAESFDATHCDAHAIP